MPSEAPTDTVTIKCNICGTNTGGTVGDGGNIITDISFLMPDFLSCGTAQDFGLLGTEFTKAQCDELQSKASICNCEFAPGSPCGEGGMVTNPLATYGNEDLIGGTGRCIAIEAIGLAGGYPPAVLLALSQDDLFLQTCGCSSTFSPTTVETSPPTLPPTVGPTPEPTLLPTPNPTPGMLKEYKMPWCLRSFCCAILTLVFLYSYP